MNSNSKTCLECGKTILSSHHLTKYCSICAYAVMRRQQKSYRRRVRKILDIKHCSYCSKRFRPWGVASRFCSDKCRKSHSDDWPKYLYSLANTKERRKHLSAGILLDMLKGQDGKCALSGIPMTCVRIKGERLWSNASIDRIRHGEEYTPDNIRLVLSAVNRFRMDIDDDIYIRVCNAVANKFPISQLTGSEEGNKKSKIKVDTSSQLRKLKYHERRTHRTRKTDRHCYGQSTDRRN